MGLFNKLGREVERFTQDAKAAADEDLEYECASCGKQFFTPPDECPVCGSTDVVGIDAERADDVTVEDGESERIDPTDSAENE